MKHFNYILVFGKPFNYIPALGWIVGVGIGAMSSTHLTKQWYLLESIGFVAMIVFGFGIPRLFKKD